MGRWVGDCLGKQSRGMRGGIGESKIAFRSECFARSYRWQHVRTCRAGGRYLFASARRKDASGQPLALPHRSGQTDQMLVFAQRCRPTRGRSRRRRCGRRARKARPVAAPKPAPERRFRAASDANRIRRATPGAGAKPAPTSAQPPAQAASPMQGAQTNGPPARPMQGATPWPDPQPQGATGNVAWPDPPSVAQPGAASAPPIRRRRMRPQEPRRAKTQAASTPTAPATRLRLRSVHRRQLRK